MNTQKISRWLHPTKGKRIALFLAMDITAIALALVASFVLRFDGAIPSTYITSLPWLLGLAVLLKLPIFYFQRFYRMSWTFVGMEELIAIFKGITYGSLLLGTISFVFRETNLFLTFPRSILVIDYGLTLLLVGGGRMIKRVYLQWRRKPVQGKRTLVVGAGSAGEQLVRSMQKEVQIVQWPVGFVDDDPAKLGLSIHGTTVLGTSEELPQLIKKQDVESVFIAMPSAPSHVIRQMVDRVRRAGIRDIRILPPLSEIFAGNISTAQLREVNLEDLLGRSPVTIDMNAVESYLKGKIVLVTGASGSIGSELCRQVARFSPKVLVFLDQDETGIFNLEAQLKEHFSDICFENVIADVQDAHKIESVFKTYQPQAVFHAAAYKHVGLMERFPEEAVKNNALGTKVVAEAAIEHNVDKFVLISTDKAVNPSSVMGASKRLAENIILALNGKSSTQFVAVRFGNVLGSRGSVVPIFEAKIKKLEPITIRHPNMKRYFMITSEAVLLVLQAGAMGQGGEVFVLDMGQQVKIADLAKELIRLHGFEPDREIPIIYTEPLPGEKIEEELLSAEEGTQATQHERVFQANLNTSVSEETLWSTLEQFKQDQNPTTASALACLKSLIPEYRPT